MMPERTLLKAEAKQYIKQSGSNILKTTLIYIVISAVIGLLSNRLLMGSFTSLGLERYFELFSQGDFDKALAVFETMQPSAGARLIDVLLNLLGAILSIGYIIFLMNTVRNNLPCTGNLFDGFAFALKIIALHLLMGLFILLWSMLFVIPGIIASYRYRMAQYILVDDPSKSPMQCIRESKEYMKGHKMELFVLDLSFIGWDFLSAIPWIGYAIKLYTVPYINLTYVLYYENLCGSRLRSPYDEPVYDDTY